MIGGLGEQARSGNAAGDRPNQARPGPCHAFQETAAVNAVAADRVVIGAEKAARWAGLRCFAHEHSLVRFIKENRAKRVLFQCRHCVWISGRRIDRLSRIEEFQNSAFVLAAEFPMITVAEDKKGCLVIVRALSSGASASTVSGMGDGEVGVHRGLAHSNLRCRSAPETNR